MNNKISNSDKFFSTIYKWAFYLLSVLIVTPNITMSVKVSPKISYWIFIITIVEYIFGMVALYFISKKIKTKKNKLNVVSIPISKKILYGFICILVCFISIIVTSFIEILILLSKIPKV